MKYYRSVKTKIGICEVLPLSTKVAHQYYNSSPLKASRHLCFIWYHDLFTTFGAGSKATAVAFRG